MQRWLHEQLRYIRQEAETFRGHCNFAFLAEQAQHQCGRPFHRNSLRRFALRHGYAHALPEETRTVDTRVETAGPGMLFQHESSHHLWLPGTGRQQTRLLTKDDDSRRVVAGGLGDHASAWHHVHLVHTTVAAQLGRPLAYYVDNHSLFRSVGYTSRHYRYQKGPDEGEQPCVRALRTLDIGLISTGKGAAPAKGKMEKQFDYVQRRVPFLCEKHRIPALPEANRILPDVIAFSNEQRVHQETQEIPQQRWDAALRTASRVLRPVEAHHDLEVICALQDERTVKKDGTISFQGRTWKVGAFPGQKVVGCYLPDTKLILVKDHQRLWEYHL